MVQSNSLSFKCPKIFIKEGRGCPTRIDSKVKITSLLAHFEKVDFVTAKRNLITFKMGYFRPLFLFCLFNTVDRK